jgi:hypothetical protein
MPSTCLHGAGFHYLPKEYEASHGHPPTPSYLCLKREEKKCGSELLDIPEVLIPVSVL